MTFISSLAAWANAPFTVALGVAIGFALLQATGLLGLLAGGGDHDGDHDIDAADHDGDLAAHDVDADHDGSSHHDVDEAQGHGFGRQFLVGMGVGRVPLSILWQSFAIGFGFAGISANTVYLANAGTLPTATLLWTIPLSTVFGAVVTRVISQRLGRLLSDPHQEATSRTELVGQSGVVISSKVSDEFGEIRIKDKTGHVVRVVCRTRIGEARIPEGREVVVVDYDHENQHLYVAPLEEDDGRRGSPPQGQAP